MGWQQQITANALAIQAILDNAKQISDLPALSTTLQPADLLAMKIASTGVTVKATFGDLISAFQSESIEGYSTFDLFPVTGVSNKLYIAYDTNLIYYWYGSGYLQTGGQTDATSTVLYSGDAIWVGGLNYFVWADHFKIEGVEYFDYISATVTLPASDVTFDRFDNLIIQNDGVGGNTLTYIQGDASANPVKKVPDSATQLEVSFAYIEANATQPTGVSTTMIYAEGGEWTISGGGASINTASADTSMSGNINMLCTNVPHPTTLNFTAPSPILVTDDLVLSFNIKLNTQWIMTSTNRTTIDLYIMSGGSVYTDRLRVGSDLGFGFNGMLTDVIQTVSMRMTRFTNFLTRNDFNGIRLVFQRQTGETFRIDNIQINKGTTVTLPNEITKTSQLVNDGYDTINPYLAPILTASAKGDILVFTYGNYYNLGVGADNEVLVADSSELLGLKWSATGSGDKNYVHSQGTPALVWNVVHNLNKFPSVTVVDSAKSEVVAQVVYTDANNLVVTVNASTTGYVYCN